MRRLWMSSVKDAVDSLWRCVTPEEEAGELGGNEEATDGRGEGAQGTSGGDKTRTGRIEGARRLVSRSTMSP
jgi:hypothetical protein